MRGRHGHGQSSILGTILEFAIKEAITTTLDKNPKEDIVFRIKRRYCAGPRCQKCVMLCPNNVLKFKNGRIAISDIGKCSFCGLCERICPQNCITVKK